MPLSERDYYRKGMRDRQRPDYTATYLNARGDLERTDPATVLVPQSNGTYLIMHNDRELGYIDLPPRRIYVRGHAWGRMIFALLIGMIMGGVSTIWGVNTGHVLPNPSAGAPHLCLTVSCNPAITSPVSKDQVRAAMGYGQRPFVRRSAFPQKISARWERGWRQIQRPQKLARALRALQHDEQKQALMPKTRQVSSALHPPFSVYLLSKSPQIGTPQDVGTYNQSPVGHTALAERQTWNGISFERFLYGMAPVVLNTQDTSALSINTAIYQVDTFSDARTAAAYSNAVRQSYTVDQSRKMGELGSMAGADPLLPLVLAHPLTPSAWGASEYLGIGCRVAAGLTYHNIVIGVFFYSTAVPMSYGILRKDHSWCSRGSEWVLHLQSVLLGKTTAFTFG